MPNCNATAYLVEGKHSRPCPEHASREIPARLLLKSSAFFVVRKYMLADQHTEYLHDKKMTAAVHSNFIAW